MIPYLTEPLSLSTVAQLAHASVVFLQVNHLRDLAGVMRLFVQDPIRRVPLFLHLDLVSGLENNNAGLQFIADFHRIDGVITVRQPDAEAARRLKMLSIIRFFLQDSRAVDRALAVIERVRPDAVELLPGVAAVEVADAFAKVDVPRIAGGLIRSVQTVQCILDAGCVSVSTSNDALWLLNRDHRPKTRPSPSKV